VAHRFVCQVCGFTGMSRLSLSRHVSKAHRPRRCIRPSRPRCVEAAIYQTLKLLLSKTRRKLLEQFSEAQRLALEQWILAQPIVPSRGLQDQLVRGSSRHSTPTSTTMRCGLPAVYSRRDGRRFLHSASGTVGPFRLFTRLVPEHGTARFFCTVLLCPFTGVSRRQQRTRRCGHTHSLAQLLMNLKSMALPQLTWGSPSVLLLEQNIGLVSSCLHHASRSLPLDCKQVCSLFSGYKMRVAACVMVGSTANP